MDPYLCCLLGLCCPPFTEEQREKLIAIRLRRSGGTREEAARAVDFDLAMVKHMQTQASAE